ncbi:hypothetical protein AT302_02165 [Pandoraea norimbergensis]|uniref:Uncharacterized protein n=1 Tax=Pandoraea norimbergensis TaxID=93219 RepID=A0ABM5WF01_9BURK|nr:hypothetical protein AT302_02165 [Pandoraea norimbergensis]
MRRLRSVASTGFARDTRDLNWFPRCEFMSKCRLARVVHGTEIERNDVKNEVVMPFSDSRYSAGRNQTVERVA